MPTLDDVRESGQLAFFNARGDNLIYQDGSVYCVPSPTDGRDLAELVQDPRAYRVTARAGIEFGWYHLEGCECEFCRRVYCADEETTETTSERTWQLTPATRS